MKRLTAFLFSILLLSCQPMIKNGYIKQKRQKSNNMVINANGFRYDYRENRKVNIRYYISIKFIDIDSVIGKYLIISFQDPIKLDKFYSQTIPITKANGNIYIESNNIYGFKNMRGYLTKIDLVNNNGGDIILDSIEQYSRVEYIPSGYKNEL